MPPLTRVLVVLSASIFFGFYPPAARGAYADGANAIFIILLTTFFRALSLAGFCEVTKKRFLSTWRDIKQGMVAGLAQAVSVTGILGSMFFCQDL